MAQRDDTRLVACFRGHWNTPGRSLCESCGAVLEPWHRPEQPDEADIVPTEASPTEERPPKRSFVGVLTGRRRHAAS